MLWIRVLSNKEVRSIWQNEQQVCSHTIWCDINFKITNIDEWSMNSHSKNILRQNFWFRDRSKAVFRSVRNTPICKEHEVATKWADHYFHRQPGTTYWMQWRTEITDGGGRLPYTGYQESEDMIKLMRKLKSNHQ